MTALKPCPFCGAVDGVDLGVDGYDYEASPDYFAHCGGCGMNGPLDGDEAEAAARWDALPRHPLATDEELRVLQLAVLCAYSEARMGEDWSGALGAISDQRIAAVLSALERRLRGVD